MTLAAFGSNILRCRHGSMRHKASACTAWLRCLSSQNSIEFEKKRDAHVRVWRFAAPRAQSILLVEFCSSSSGTKGPEREGNMLRLRRISTFGPHPHPPGHPPGRGGPRTCTPTLPSWVKIDPPFGPFWTPPKGTIWTRSRDEGSAMAQKRGSRRRCIIVCRLFDPKRERETPPTRHMKMTKNPTHYSPSHSPTHFAERGTPQDPSPTPPGPPRGPP